MKTIEEATGLIPETIADNITSEARTFANVPDNATDWLCQRARHQWEQQSVFARHMLKSDGRDTLYSFMRHWLAAYLLGTGTPRRDIPAAWSNGNPLP